MHRKHLVLAALLVAPALSLAQSGPPPGAPPHGKGMGAARKFDPSTVVTVSGTVVGESRVDRGTGHKGVHLLVRTADGNLAVHLGPDSYVDQQPVRIAAGDEVTVKGSKVNLDGKPVLLAVTVTKAGGTLVLRDDRGVPAWGGKGGGRGPGPGAGSGAQVR